MSLIIVSFLFSSLAFAIGLDEAKQKGLVGERNNGYLGLVVNQMDEKKTRQKESQNLINDINAKRKAVYVKLAAKNGITLQQVEKLAAEKAYKKTSTGHYLWMNGMWVKK
jgi:uncharacterized protein YdbL (DUF1318 family)|tara:strand:- start:1717 stop:2046 length:330 start_codon:yes stop_codon:yes gene_type:complete